eukprot:10365474-Prorocentrum_lima.AAC.1
MCIRDRKWYALAMAIKKNPVFGQASDRSSALGGTHTGVYLLYGHPTCDWNYTLKKIHNRNRFQGC